MVFSRVPYNSKREVGFLFRNGLCCQHHQVLACSIQLNNPCSRASELQWNLSNQDALGPYIMS